MAKCYHPLPATRWKAGGVSIGRHRRLGDGVSMDLPCGKCVGCRLRRAQSWALRCFHELQLHDDSVFLTLTYDDEHLPGDRSLRYSDVQSFFRRLRHSGSFRFFMCGEYGSRTSRPHYHVLLFGRSFPDRVAYDGTLFTSPTIDKAWGLGSARFGRVELASVAYVTGYVAEKFEAKEYPGRRKPFCKMSNRPAIGRDFALKYLPDFRDGAAVFDGRKIPLPRYYRELIKARDPELVASWDEKAFAALQERFTPAEYEFESSSERLGVGEAVAEARQRFFSSRGQENFSG